MNVTREELEARIQNAVYKRSIKLCEETEHSGHGGNGHHKAQNLCAGVIEELQPFIAKWQKAMSPQVHELKTQTEFFEAVRDGSKPFEVRLNDRNYAVGDLLLLREWNGESFTHECCARVVISVLQGGQFGITADYVVMGIRPLHVGEASCYRESARARFWLGLREEDE